MQTRLGSHVAVDSRLVATAPIRPLAWESPYAVGAALEKAKRQKKKRKEISRARKSIQTETKLVVVEHKFMCLTHSEVNKTIMSEMVEEKGLLQAL